jgi:hypothetical protein
VLGTEAAARRDRVLVESNSLSYIGKTMADDYLRRFGPGNKVPLEDALAPGFGRQISSCQKYAGHPRRGQDPP